MTPSLEVAKLDNERPAIDGVDDNPPTLERVVAPSSRIPEGLTAARQSVVAGENVKVRNLRDAGAGGVRGDARHVEHAEPGLVIGLVREAVVDELVVVDGAGGRLVVAGVYGRLEVRDVEDVGHGEAVEGGGVGGGVDGVDFALVELVV